MIEYDLMDFTGIVYTGIGAPHHSPELMMLLHTSYIAMCVGSAPIRGHQILK